MIFRWQGVNPTITTFEGLLELLQQSPTHYEYMLTGWTITAEQESQINQMGWIISSRDKKANEIWLRKSNQETTSE